MPLRVLTVARWYPSHDLPGRGSFVADLVDATRRHGAEHVVASFERIGPTLQLPSPVAQRREAAHAFAERLEPAAVLASPTARGAGVPVARLPVVTLPRDAGVGAARAGAEIEAHAEALAPFVERLVRTWRPAVIHAHTGVPDGIVSARIGDRWGIPVVVSEHASTLETTLADPDARAGYRDLLDSPARVVAVSPALRSRLALALDAREDRIGVLPNVVAVDAFSDAEAQDRNVGELLWIGSRGRYKGIEHLLRAVALVRRVRPDVTLRLIGRPTLPQEDDEWRALAGELGLLDRLALEDWADRTAVARAMRHAAVLVHPSPAETFGLVAAEAIAAGLPVASRRSGGVPWIIESSGGYGAVAVDDSVEAFAEAIVSLLERPPLTNAARALDFIRTTFGSDAVAEQAMTLYRGVGAARAAGRQVAPEAVAVDDVSKGAHALAAGRTPATALLASSNRIHAIRVAALIPEQFRDRVTVITDAPKPGPVNPAPGNNAERGPRLIEIELDGPYREALRRINRWPAVPSLIRRLLRRWLEQRRANARERLQLRRTEMRLDALSAAIRTEIRTRPADAGSPATVVALDLGAVLATLACAPDADLAPGAARWLVDRWDAAGGSAPTGEEG